MNGVVIFLLWVYASGVKFVKFFNCIYNLKANCRAYILRTVFHDNGSVLSVYGNDDIWETIYDYETEDTMLLILLYIKVRLGLTKFRRHYIDEWLINNHKFYVETLYDKDVGKMETIKSLNKKSDVTPFKPVNICFAILDDIDITHYLKGYQPSIRKVNISVRDLIIILKNKYDMKIKENAELTIFDVDTMEEQTLKGDDIINI